MGKSTRLRTGSDLKFVFVPGRKRTRRAAQKTAVSGFLDGSLPTDARRTGNGIQEGKE